MGKKLADMTLEELWHLFPIILTEHRDEWAQWYEEEKALLTSLLPPSSVIHHVGSTAIKGIWAKPIVDILVVLPDAAALRAARSVLTGAGYLCMSESGARISLNKGYTETGFAERVFHIHLRLPGDNDEVTFRDYLNVHPDDTRAYEALKLRLWHPYEHDRDGYTAAKTDFVQRIMRAARVGGIAVIADGITISRILFSLLLFVCSPFSTSFGTGYILCGVTDVLDGFAARRLHTVSERGAALDSAADMVFAVVYAVRVLPLLLPLPLWITVWTAVIAVCKITVIICQSIRAHRLYVRHSLANKLTGVLLFLLPLSVYPAGSAVYGATVVCAAATVAVTAEIVSCLTQKR